MAIFTAIGTAIAGALFAGSALAASIISGGLAFAANLAFSYLNRPKKRTYSAVQGDAQFGGNIPVGTLYGIGKINRGQRLYWAKWGSGNKYNVDVWRLANGWCDGLEPEVYFYGKKHILEPVATIGNEAARYQVSGFGEKLTIRFYDGRPGQQADARLVSVTNSLGTPWKATSRCTGMAYVIIEREWDENLFSQGHPEIEFVLRGLRLYDPRKDSTVVGGSGSHRLNQPSTWEFSQNPALQRLNYQLGLRGLISQRSLIGEGKSLGQLDLGTYFAAMNVCDTLRNGKPTYQAALYVSSDDDHTEVLKEFDDAMAGYGLNRRGLSGVIPGAPQIPVATITANDIPVERAQQKQLRKSAFELYNYLSGQFISREDQWNPASLKPVYVSADVAADGRPRQTSNDFLQVSDPDIAQYLLNIRYRQNRKGGSATVPVSRRLGLGVQEGEWITFDGRTWLIREWQCDESFNVTLTLAETGADVYSEAGIEPGPIIIPSTPPINPSLLSTVQNFNVEVGMIGGSEGYQVPALRFTWDPPADPTIRAVRFFYCVGMSSTGATIYEDQTADAEAGECITTKNVVSGVFYTARATISTRPDRFKSFTPWKTTATVTGPLTVYPEGLVEEIQEVVAEATEWIGNGTRELIEEARRNLNNDSGGSAQSYLDRQVLRRELTSTSQRAEAKWTEDILAATGPGSAIVLRLETLEVKVEGDIATAVDLLQTQITTIDGRVTANANAVTALTAQVGNFTAAGLFRVETVATETGAQSTIGLSASATGGGTTHTAALFISALTGGLSRVTVVADQFAITDGSSRANPFIFQGGVARMNMANIGTVTAGVIRSPDNRFIITLSNGSIEWFE
ncbi:phage tail protein [Aquamicrobium sp. LC103]|uniref:phage tail tip fiber protein n=1 Tax=Aquamicrobium sp. LC103 TaxID=1120658 RepID=UPI00063EC15B|nr:phage tail protein [Aquamicrobium sp. LC103]TKT79963.1 phage tail protein [Aquamicrobium sp. LC103]